jgi:ABC-type glycerol-3-phosphate transport system substrate-binding protein
MSRYLQTAPETISPETIPNQDGEVVSFASGWVWAVATPNTERQAAAESLAEFLTEADFTGRWSEAAGLLPIRPSGLTTWDAGPTRTLAGRVLRNAQAVPGERILTVIGPPLQQAVVAILKQELTVSEAVDQALALLDAVGN